MPLSFAALTTASTFSRFPILPGLIRILSAPPSMAFKAIYSQNEYQQQAEY